MRYQPSGERVATSPVLNQPPDVTASQAFGLPSYPRKRFGPRTSSSPGSSAPRRMASPRSSTRRTSTPGRVGPTDPGRAGAEMGSAQFMRVSVRPYRSRTGRPVAASRRRWSRGGRGADPDTRSRADERARATAGSASAASARSRYIVGTANAIVPPAASSAEIARDSNRPTWRTRPPTRSDPSTPSTRPCTWNRGRPWTSTSAAVHPHTEASESRFDAIALRGMIAPLGGPVVPDVMNRNAGASGSSGSRGSRRGRRTPSTSTSIRGSARRGSGIVAPGGARRSRGATSLRTCEAPIGPRSGSSGTRTDPDRIAATTATHVSTERVAQTATVSPRGSPDPNDDAAEARSP